MSLGWRDGLVPAFVCRLIADRVVLGTLED